MKVFGVVFRCLQVKRICALILFLSTTSVYSQTENLFFDHGDLIKDKKIQHFKVVQMKDPDKDTSDYTTIDYTIDRKKCTISIVSSFNNYKKNTRECLYSQVDFDNDGNLISWIRMDSAKKVSSKSRFEIKKDTLFYDYEVFRKAFGISAQRNFELLDVIFILLIKRPVVLVERCFWTSWKDNKVHENGSLISKYQLRYDNKDEKQLVDVLYTQDLDSIQLHYEFDKKGRLLQKETIERQRWMSTPQRSVTTLKFNDKDYVESIVFNYGNPTLYRFDYHYGDDGRWVAYKKVFDNGWHEEFKRSYSK